MARCLLDQILLSYIDLKNNAFPCARFFLITLSQLENISVWLDIFLYLLGNKLKIYVMASVFYFVGFFFFAFFWGGVGKEAIRILYTSVLAEGQIGILQTMGEFSELL